MGDIWMDFLIFLFFFLLHIWRLNNSFFQLKPVWIYLWVKNEQTNWSNQPKSFEVVRYLYQMKWQLRQQCHSTCGTGCYSLGILTSLKKLLAFESLLSPNHLVTFPKMKQQNMFLKILSGYWDNIVWCSTETYWKSTVKRPGKRQGGVLSYIHVS